MNPIEHPSATRALGAPRNWDQERDGACGVLPIADIVDEQRHAVMESFWKPEPAELAALNTGSAVILQVYGIVHPVVSIAVTALPVTSK